MAITSDLENAFKQLIAAVGGAHPLPAGGAAGVVSLAIGTALGMKVFRLSDVGEAETELKRLLSQIVPRFREDCEVFNELLICFKTPRTNPGRTDAIHGAWRGATTAPVSVACLAAQVETCLEEFRERVKPGLKGDLRAARNLVHAGRCIARENAIENAEHLEPAVAQKVLEDLNDDS